MSHWLFKSEPGTFSIYNLQQRPSQTEHWDGVRNYQARNFLRDRMHVGDLVFFYHSNCDVPGIVGVMEVVSEGYPDFTAWNAESHGYDPKASAENPRRYMVDVRFKKKFKHVISLQEIKQHPVLQKMLVARPGNRLSITPVTETEWKAVLKLEN